MELTTYVYYCVLEQSVATNNYKWFWNRYKFAYQFWTMYICY